MQRVQLRKVIIFEKKHRDQSETEGWLHFFCNDADGDPIGVIELQDGTLVPELIGNFKFKQEADNDKS